MYCLQCFSSEKVLNNHKEVCLVINGKQSIKMPEKGEKIMFKNHHKQLPVPFVIYADFEDTQQKYMGVNQIIMNHILNHMKSIWIAHLGIK